MENSAQPVSSKGYATIYTDGACKGNPGPGGYAALVIRADGSRTEISGGFRRTTNNRMELYALLKALEAFTEPCPVEVFTDSQYLLGGFQKNWVKSWKRNGWLTSSKEPVLNRDLWMKLDELLLRRRVLFHWVRGHADNKENNRCDELAVEASHARNLPEDEGYDVYARKQAVREEVEKRKEESRLPRAQKRPGDWDDDLFSNAAKNSGGTVNWDF